MPKIIKIGQSFTELFIT